MEDPEWDRRNLPFFTERKWKMCITIDYTSFRHALACALLRSGVEVKVRRSVDTPVHTYYMYVQCTHIIMSLHVFLEGT